MDAACEGLSVTDEQCNDFELDLRGVKCPMNFVKTRLFLDTMVNGQTVRVLIDPGEPVESVSSSIQADGHEILSSIPDGSGHCCLSIRKV